MKRGTKLLSLASVLIWGLHAQSNPGSTSAQTAAGTASESAPEKAIVLQDVRLIAGSGYAPVSHASILIQDGKIAQIVTYGNGNDQWPPDANVMKLTGKTVMPGIINGHGHLGLSQGLTVGPQNYTEQNIEQQMLQYERYGVTSMISLGMNQDLLYDIIARQKRGEIGGATVMTADRGLGTPGGVPGVDVGSNQVYRPATPQEARADVDEMATRHPTLVKIWVDTGLGKSPAPNPAVYAAAINEAHKKHMRVAVHVYYLADAKRVAQDGADILAHSIRDQPVDSEMIALLKKHKMYYIPTIQLEEAFFIYADHPAWMDDAFFKSAVTPEVMAHLLSPEYKQKVTQDPTTAIHRAALRTAMTNLKTLQDAGIPIGFGTDSGANPYRIQGFAEHRELQLMVEAGLTPIQAIHSATGVNAQMLHIDTKTGTIQQGKQADLIVVDGDPSQNIADTEKIVMVFHNGREVKR